MSHSSVMLLLKLRDKAELGTGIGFQSYLGVQFLLSHDIYCMPPVDLNFRSLNKVTSP